MPPYCWLGAVVVGDGAAVVAVGGGTVVVVVGFGAVVVVVGDGAVVGFGVVAGVVLAQAGKSNTNMRIAKNP